MEQTKLLSYIDNISAIIAKKAKFDIYDEDDIKQEIYFLILKAEQYFDPEKGDEFTFYLNFAAKRLKTFKRDKYTVNSEKQGIADAAPLEDDIMQKMEFELEASLSKYSTAIDEKMPANYRADFLRFKDGAKIPHRNKQIIIECIKDIIRRERDG